MIDRIGRNAPVVVLSALIAGGCATTREKQAYDSLDHVRFYDGKRAAQADLPPPSGSLASYVAYAMKRNPQLRAAFERWRAAVHSIATKRQLPDPTISYGLFVRRVETRVGPQRHRFSLRQTIPWPSKLGTAADAASDEANAAEQMFRARALAIRRRVAAAYWAIWLLDRETEIQGKQRTLLRALSAAVRARVEIGKASLADLNQVDLSVSRLSDQLQSLAARRRAARARLVDVIGAPADTPTPLKASEPGTGLPHRQRAELERLALAHPAISAVELKAAAEIDRARHAHTGGLPNLMLGLDYIETGPAAMAGVADSGKDPVIVSVGISLPIWRGSYAEAETAARARAASWRATGLAARNKARANLRATLAKLRDAHRRMTTYRKTLIPQAETVYSAVTGTFQTGAASLANVLIAERDLLTLRLGLARARATYATTWAALEQIVGRALTSKEPS